MRFLRLITLSAALSGLVIISASAEEPDKFIRDGQPEQSEQKEDAGITTGCVIAYGEILEPPYYVVVKDGILFINEIQFQPRKENPNAPKRERKTHFSEFSTKKYEFKKGLIDAYTENYRRFGREKADQIILDGFRNSELISKAELINGSLRIQFIDEKSPIRINLSSYISMIGWTPPTQQELAEGEAGLVRLSLNMDLTILFSYGYDMSLNSVLSERLEKIISQLKDGKVSVADAEAEIFEITRSSIFTKDIIKSILNKQ